MKKGIFLVIHVLLCYAGGILPAGAQPVNLNPIYTTPQSSGARLVYAAYQDREGYMWFAESGRVSRFDGATTLILEHDPLDSNSLSNPVARCIIEDDSGKIWIGTQGGGLNCYDRKKELFHHFRHDPQNPASLSHDEVLSLYLDAAGRLWVGTENGLNLMDRAQGTFRRFMPDPGDSTALQAPAVLALLEDRQGILWAATWNGGLHRIARQALPGGKLSVSFQAYTHDPEDPYSLPFSFLWRLHEDPEGRLWVGSFGGGVAVMYPPGMQPPGRSAGKPAFLRLPFGPDAATIHGASIWSMTSDDAGRLWVGTTEGLAISAPLPPTPNRKAFEALKQLAFQNIFRQEFGMAGIPSNKIRDLCKDRDGRIWVATENGVSLYDPFTSLFSNYLAPPQVKERFSVSALAKDRHGSLWAGTKTQGLIRYDLATGKYLQFHKEAKLPTQRLSHNEIQALYADKQGRIWVGSPNMLTVIHTATLAVHNYPIQFPGAQGEVLIQNIRPDSLGHVWLMTWSGLVRIKPESMRMRFYFPDTQQPEGLPDSQTNDMAVDSMGTMWMTTESKGLLAVRQLADGRLHCQSYDYNQDMASLLNKSYRALEASDKGLWIGTMMGVLYFDFATKQFSRIGNHSDLKNPVISSLTRDHDNQLWITTAAGIYRYNPRNQHFSSFDRSYGLMSQDFVEYDALCDENGILYFGGDRGVASMDPRHQPARLPLAKIRLDDLLIFNQRIQVGVPDPDTHRPILQNALAYTPRIELAHTQSTLRFVISRIDFTRPEAGRIAYRLAGLETEWSEQDVLHTISYTHLEPGNYTLQVRAANAEDVWNDEVNELRIFIAPPFWQTWWFRLLAAMAGILAIWGFLFIRTRSIEQQRQELARKVSLRTRELAIANQKEKEARKAAESASQAKAQFLSVMSHEIRTPIHAVISMTQFLMNEHPRVDQKEHLQILHFSANNLLALINDVLDFSKIEAGKLELENISFDLHQLTEDVAKSIGIRCEEKGIGMRYEYDASLPKRVEGDATRLGQILANLLGNAVKFTEKGYISLKVSATPHGGQRFEIRDTGIGIPYDKQELIFDEFSQSSSETSRRFGGTGLGLAISRRLVQMMNSDIRLSSEPGVGSCFFFDLALPECTALLCSPEVEGAALGPESLAHLGILLAEDNLINQKIMIRIMDQWGARMRIANNGEEALVCMENEAFDLVFMDIQMPEMDGLTATRIIRERGHTVPVIGLSANAGKDEVVTAMESGMTDFLAKPFTSESLAQKLVVYAQVRV